MQHHIDTTSQLDLVRRDAAARQRRAATYRFVHAQRPTPTGRRSLATALTVAALSLGIIGGAAAQVVDSQPVPQGYQAGLPDGWFDPSAPTVVAADDDVTPASTPVRQGYLPGHPDGWFNAEEPTVKVAGVVLDRAPTPTCAGYQPGLPDGCHQFDSPARAADDTTLVPHNVR